MIERLATAGYESVAVGFIHSYVDGTNERRFRELLLERLPDVSVSISCEVSPQMREYERFNTVCANAYVQPLMASYLVRLRDQLQARGITCPLYLVHSGGGLMSVESAAEFPVRLVESGPAGGAIFAADIAARYGPRPSPQLRHGWNHGEDQPDRRLPSGHREVVRGRPHRSLQEGQWHAHLDPGHRHDRDRCRRRFDRQSVDSLDQIRIGPHSAGSEPGPAAYSLGGQDATVTDANLQLGRLHPDTFGASDIDLSPRSRADALTRSVGERLGLDADTAAVGVAEVVDENMANAARGPRRRERQGPRRLHDDRLRWRRAAARRVA